jgi:hypothetical protein
MLECSAKIFLAFPDVGAEGDVDGDHESPETISSPRAK